MIEIDPHSDSRSPQSALSEVCALLNPTLRDRERSLGSSSAAMSAWANLARDGWFARLAQAAGDGDRALRMGEWFRALGYRCEDNGWILSLHAHCWGGILPLVSYGEGDYQKHCLSQCLSGAWVSAHGATEPGCGSRFEKTASVAVPERDGFRLTGEKTLIANAAFAHLFVVYARIAGSQGLGGIEAFLVEGDRPGVEVAPPLEPMGLKTCGLGAVRFNEVRLPKASRLGSPGSGFSIFQHMLAWERTFVAFTLSGTMARIVEQVGRRLGLSAPEPKPSFIHRRWKRMQKRLHLAEGLSGEALAKLARGERSVREAALAKWRVSEMHLANCEDAFRLMGGKAYLQSESWERELRDALGAIHYSGTSDMLRTLVRGLE